MKMTKEKKVMTKLKEMQLPSMLAFERKLEVSDGLMFAGNWSDLTKETGWEAIKVVPRKNRATQSAYGIDDEKKTKPNPVSAGHQDDDANLPHDKDTLKVSFTLRMIGDLGAPFGCNDPDFEKAIHTKVTEFKEQGLKELAHRYAQNIASGRFLWRNRVCAEELLIQVRINHAEDLMVLNGYDYALNDFAANRQDNKLAQLTEAIYRGLVGSQDFVLLEVDAFVRLGAGQHVFPSQEMNMGEKKKVLFKLGKDNNHAAMHSVKLGNAIRTIDDWYSESAEFPIAVEPYGSVTQRGEAYRKSRSKESAGDLYTLMLDWVNDKPVADEQKCYVLANIIRGGVFGGKSE
ncbi:type I-F CRISPR-associated protein Csy3 [Amphritea pacifica]|uniref:Type I-F CRISPR-associated protein Csy3 n=1 Tax=Amphritea pacifica TaxID=2811233 RepID=A0ABS2W7F1_9GAMM|nr:type I-F CRISPR-associated protein Csy3 [Amphritea pacifica]MBN0987634.1 type I-F CRISPR-associated protein Csy3 [Amphritea pacifica]